ncbi:MAG: hypothetical protein KAJ73_00450 [Zetaproteobacteria bacterium]|nr:hypothetical protein [Zetaproteobacteria bacterium]
MSHTTTIGTILFADIGALQGAIKELKSQGIQCKLLENAAPRAYSANQSGMGKAPYVVNLPNADYDIGLYPSESGEGLEPRTDFYRGSVQRELGAEHVKPGEDTEQAKIGKLVQMYAIHAAERKAVQQGMQVTRVPTDNGGLQLKIVA